MAVTSVKQKSSTELTDEWAHDAGIIAKDEKLSSSACARSGAALHKGRTDDMHAAKEFAKEVGDHGVWTAVELVAHVKHAAELATAVEGAMAVAGPLGMGALFIHQMVDAKQKEAEIKNAFANDAANVAIACALDFHDGFKNAEKQARPGVEKGAEKLMMKLEVGNKDLKPELQRRADEGFLVAKRASEATAHLPEKDRPQAITAWLEKNGYGKRLENDLPFGKGAAYYGWCTSAAGKAAGASVDAVCSKIEARRVPPQYGTVRG